MSSQFINGAQYAVSPLAAAVAFSALSNANPAVASCATPPANGSVVVVTSGWEDINGGVFRTAGQVAATSFQLEDFDSTDAVRFPAGEGAGTFQLANAFTSLSQVRDIPTEGGDQQYFAYQYVGDKSRRQRRKPTYKNAMGMKIVLDYDPDLPWYQALVDLDFKAQPVVLRETLPGGDVIYYVGDVSFNKVPSKGMNENMTVTASFSFNSDPMRYPGA